MSELELSFKIVQGIVIVVVVVMLCHCMLFISCSKKDRRPQQSLHLQSVQSITVASSQRWKVITVMR